ncbi:hypothetical protein [Desulfoscipio geothermicus]|uniref:Uncharacterized protein n=1 Tax=Desulfoscipio geothermicus DSM 3669 TaxID=1121426 RepID=A0A1I6D176_9FIRM|nr:hypothetical protein [Desulfoscipio geothermicus]SFQ99082.1 hypothetical protein SAMN05660706_10421 [Desulfoscipio geothermicus DSM 3669]
MEKMASSGFIHRNFKRNAEELQNMAVKFKVDDILRGGLNKGAKTAFIIFTFLCIGGIFASLARGNVNTVHFKRKAHNKELILVCAFLFNNL